jgi:hypothetical protein
MIRRPLKLRRMHCLQTSGKLANVDLAPEEMEAEISFLLDIWLSVPVCHSCSLHSYMHYNCLISLHILPGPRI